MCTDCMLNSNHRHRYCSDGLQRQHTRNWNHMNAKVRHTSVVGLPQVLHVQRIHHGMRQAVMRYQCAAAAAISMTTINGVWHTAGQSVLVPTCKVCVSQKILRTCRSDVLTNIKTPVEQPVTGSAASE